MSHPWSAQVIAPEWPEPERRIPRPAALLRTEFTLAATPRAAWFRATALGVYELELNGARVSDHVLAPGWTSYHQRHRYQAYDVGFALQQGCNALGGWLADGWYRGRLGFNGGLSDIYGSETGLLVELRVSFEDGSEQLVATGPTWRSALSPVTATGLYEGEHYDARREPVGWSKPCFDDTGWNRVQLLDCDTSVLFAADSPPLRRIETLKPMRVSASRSGRTLVDFGQNLVGRLRIRVRGERGRIVTLRHAEVLEGGELCTRPLRTATATDRYTLRGDPGGEVWEPRFTIHGFRHVEIDGWPGELKPEQFAAVVVHSDLRRTGWFESSDETLNRLHENIVWSMRGNFLDVPTDCPQGDERLGWTGDMQVFAPAAAFLYDVQDFLRSWLRDLAADQSRDERGIPPLISPEIPLCLPDGVPPGRISMAGWCDAAVIVPWVLYQRYGDRGALAEQYASMRAWVDAIDSIVGPSHIWEQQFQFGDWLDPKASPEEPAKATTSPSLVATAYFAQSTRLLARAAHVLGKREDARRYGTLADGIRTGFLARFSAGDGSLTEEPRLPTPWRCVST